MHSRIAANQQRLFLVFLGRILPHLRTDSALPHRLRQMLARDRKLGSRDRRLYRELLYTALRYLPWIEPYRESEPDRAAQLVAWLAPEISDTARYREVLLENWPATSTSVCEKAAQLSSRFGQPFSPDALLPEWFRAHCPAAFTTPHLDTLLARAPIWIRLQTTERALVLDECRAHGWTPQPSPLSPDAFALPPNAEVAEMDAYRRGFVEIQDLGSQLIVHSLPIQSNERWLDACAGAGGKSLLLATRVGHDGCVDATDVRPAALSELAERAKRARLSQIHPTRSPNRDYDGVLVDAPCSGTGTWRRMPHMKWFSEPELPARFAATQGKILQENAARVRPGGLLAYATCSLSPVENHDVATTFLASHSDYYSVPAACDYGGVSDGLGTTFLPGTHNTDGFYVALFRRRS